MPIYEYECTQCGTVTDIKHGFKETTSETCPKCSGELKRIFNPAGIVFKGSGFYVTDSRKPSSSSSGDAPKSESTTSAKSEPGAPAKSPSGGKSDSGGKGDAAA